MNGRYQTTGAFRAALEERLKHLALACGLTDLPMDEAFQQVAAYWAALSASPRSE